MTADPKKSPQNREDESRFLSEGGQSGEREPVTDKNWTLSQTRGENDYARADAGWDAKKSANGLSERLDKETTLDGDEPISGDQGETRDEEHEAWRSEQTVKLEARYASADKATAQSSGTGKPKEDATKSEPDKPNSEPARNG